jgi:non-ribosomal peptide synthetase component E (peptide arylation enzyme)
MTTTSRLHDFLDHWANARPETLFAVQGERRLTYREALDTVNRLANAFVAAGLRVGDRVESEDDQQWHAHTPS